MFPADEQRQAAERIGLVRELEVALECAREAGAILHRYFEAGEQGWEKRENDPVTQADLDADAVIQRRLQEHFPGDDLISEEHQPRAARAGARTWIVDPMDGTHEFVARVPEFAVSIALVEEGVPLVGVIANPMAGVTVSAVRGGGTWRDAERVSVSQVPRLSDAIAVASRSETKRGDWDAFTPWFGQIRRMGSIAWKLSAVACRVGDLNLSLRPKHSWDVCAGDLLVREAGGVYLDREGRAPHYTAARLDVPAGMAAGPRPLVESFFERAARSPGLLDAESRRSREKDETAGDQDV